MVAGVSFRRGLLALTGAGLLLRLLWVALEPATGPVADETMWVDWGSRELPAVGFSPLRLRFIFHPPLYLYFLGTVNAAFGTLEAVKYAQAVVGSLLVPAVGLVGRRGFGEKAALVAAFVAAFYPELVWFVAHFWAETLFTVLLWWAIERTAAADARGSLPLAVAAGALFGLATLTRETVLYFLPAAALWLAWRRAGGVRRAAAFLVTSLLIVVPWTVRNYLAFDALVPVSTSGALNLWQGNTRMSRQEVYEEYWSVHGRIAKYEHARRRGIEAVLERQPWWILEKLRDEMPEYWAAHGQPIVHVERGAYGPVTDRRAAYAAIAVVLLPYLAVLLLFVAGIAFLPAARVPVLLLGFLAFYVLLHVASHGYPRYRLPSMPAVFLVAAHGGVVAFGARARPRVGRLRALAAAAVGVTLALSVGPSLVAWASAPWPPPWFAEETGTGTEGATEAPAPEHP
jgi:4-amino-4-deoxy-L-arabinose transferase-like glycosyltransferase